MLEVDSQVLALMEQSRQVHFGSSVNKKLQKKTKNLQILLLLRIFSLLCHAVHSKSLHILCFITYIFGIGQQIESNLQEIFFAECIIILHFTKSKQPLFTKMMANCPFMNNSKCKCELIHQFQSYENTLKFSFFSSIFNHTCYYWTWW